MVWEFFDMRCRANALQGGVHHGAAQLPPSHLVFRTVRSGLGQPAPHGINFFMAFLAERPIRVQHYNETNSTSPSQRYNCVLDHD